LIDEELTIKGIEVSYLLGKIISELRKLILKGIF
jgi:hypothetical protein